MQSSDITVIGLTLHCRVVVGGDADGKSGRIRMKTTFGAGTASAGVELTTGTAAEIKQADIGTVNPGDGITISFWAKNINSVGGVGA